MIQAGRGLRKANGASIMTDSQDTPTTSLNARVGAIVLTICAPLNLILHMQGPALGPLSYAVWLGLSFGLLCFCDEMGAARPLNRGGLIALAAAFVADTLLTLSADPSLVARASVLYAFAVLGAVVLWSVALMHRKQTARAIGAIGALVGGGALALLVAAHVLLGAATVLGFSQLFAALQEPGHSTLAALMLIDAVLCVWSLPIAFLLWTARLRR